jgi:hypothetical protein
LHELCRSSLTIGGTAVGLVVGLPGTLGGAAAMGMAGASVGTLVGHLVCEHLSGLDEAVKPPALTHCEPSYHTQNPRR